MTKVVEFLKCGLFVLLLVFAAQSYAGDKPYIVTDGKVDAYTFQGWQVFQDVKCGLCHGDSGQGGAAPNLGQRLKTISKNQFIESVTRGKGLMPPWITNKKVIDNIDKIYAYLKARSDGVLGEGKPEKQ
jgi:mono/diheme cytochrome c family protein